MPQEMHDMMDEKHTPRTKKKRRHT
jgi:hypothetical protein